MADRITQVVAEVEYAPIHKDRATQVIAEVEHVSIHYDRVTKFMIQVEWRYPEAPVRKYGPAIQ